MAAYLHYLNDAQEQALLEHATRTSFEPGATILSEGEQRHALYLIRDGQVRVELEHPEFNIEITKLSEGDIFGEMSLLEDLTVSANVIADSRVDVDICDASALSSLFNSDSELEGRFFKSLAYILSIRLRDTTLRGFG